MRHVFIISLLFFYFGIAYAQDSWHTVIIPGLCQFKIPPTMEIQAGAYKEYDDASAAYLLGVDTSDRVMAQQKGLNEQAPGAAQQYARVIVETEWGKPGDFQQLGGPLIISPEELDLFNEVGPELMQAMWSQGNAKVMNMQVVKWYPAQVVNINGIDMLLITYERTVSDNPPALVRMYSVENNDCSLMITVSYRLSETHLWAKDLDQVIKTFQFEKR